MRYPQRRARLAAIRMDPPPGWGALFAPVPGRSGKTRCLLCGATGHGPSGKADTTATFTGRPVLPAPWQAVHLLGHPVQCGTCRRPFTGPGAVRTHQTCKVHHACCLDHTTVPAWKNPFGAASCT